MLLNLKIVFYSSDLKQLDAIKARMEKRKNLEEEIELLEKCFVFYECKDLAKKVGNVKNKRKEEKGSLRLMKIFVK